MLQLRRRGVVKGNRWYCNCRAQEIHNTLSSLTHPPKASKLTPTSSYGGREQALQQKAQATGGQLLGEAKEGMGIVEAKGQEAVQEGKGMLRKVEKKLGK